MRLPKQVLVIPYRVANDKIEYCIFKRSDMDAWQWIAGGMEDFDNDILTAAKREANEEANISYDMEYIKLEEMTSIPVVNVVKTNIWGDDVFFVYEYSFAVNLKDYDIHLSSEHKEFKWVSYDEAIKLLKYDSNKNALWELNEKIKKGVIKCI